MFKKLAHGPELKFVGQKHFLLQTNDVVEISLAKKNVVGSQSQEARLSRLANSKTELLELKEEEEKQCWNW